MLKQLRHFHDEMCLAIYDRLIEVRPQVRESADMRALGLLSMGHAGYFVSFTSLIETNASSIFSKTWPVLFVALIPYSFWALRRLKERTRTWMAEYESNEPGKAVWRRRWRRIALWYRLVGLASVVIVGLLEYPSPLAEIDPGVLTEIDPSQRWRSELSAARGAGKVDGGAG